VPWSASEQGLNTLRDAATRDCGYAGRGPQLPLEDIDYDEKVIRIRRQLKTLGKHTVYALPKNDRERVVPMADWTAECIRVHVAKFGTLTCTLPWEKPDGKERTHNLLQRWIGGGHMKSRAYSETAWKPALVAAGVIPEPTKDARGRRRYVTTRREARTSSATTTPACNSRTV
jgi:integrase